MDTFTSAIEGLIIGALRGCSGARSGDVVALATGGFGSAGRWRGDAQADMTDQESDFDRQAVDDMLDAFTGS